jgi:hypothetical protein
LLPLMPVTVKVVRVAVVGKEPLANEQLPALEVRQRTAAAPG